MHSSAAGESGCTFEGIGQRWPVVDARELQLRVVIGAHGLQHLLPAGLRRRAVSRVWWSRCNRHETRILRSIDFDTERDDDAAQRHKMPQIFVQDQDIISDALGRAERHVQASVSNAFGAEEAGFKYH